MRPFSLQIPQPCPQSWADMHPNDRGRYCASCQKTVVDYTTLSDQELITLLGKPTAETRCGRFRNDQLNRPLVAELSTRETNWHRWVSLLTMGWLGLQTAFSQQHPTSPAQSPPTQSSPVQPRFNPITRSDRSVATNHSIPLTISGRVMLDDTVGVRPLPNAYVTIARWNESWHVKTDSNGTYNLTVMTQQQPTAFNVMVNGGTGLRSSCHIQTTGTEKTIQLSDVALMIYGSLHTVEVSGGGIAILHTPTRWQRFWRGLLHREPRQNG
jgi:hypothetical protein